MAFTERFFFSYTMSNIKGWKGRFFLLRSKHATWPFPTKTQVFNDCEKKDINKIVPSQRFEEEKLSFQFLREVVGDNGHARSDGCLTLEFLSTHGV